MKPYLKALIPATGVSLMLICLTTLMHFMFYGMEAFEDFFGVTVGKFNPVIYLIIFMILLVIFTFIFKSDFEEAK